MTADIPSAGRCGALVSRYLWTAIQPPRPEESITRGLCELVKRRFQVSIPGADLPTAELTAWSQGLRQPISSTIPIWETERRNPLDRLDHEPTLANEIWNVAGHLTACEHPTKK